MATIHKKVSCLLDEVAKTNPNINICLDFSLAKLTTYRIGGNAAAFCKVDSASELEQLIKIASKIKLKYFVIGSGSNLLVSDNGYVGLIIKLGRSFKDIQVDLTNNKIIAGGAASFAKVAKVAANNYLGGMEFSTGTPGTIGGATRMNAGTAQDWIGKRIEYVKILNAKGDYVTKKSDDLKWGYRSSSFDESDIILEIGLKLERVDDCSAIQDNMKRIFDRRHANQPLGARTCGCSFKNPVNESAGKLIEQAGLKNTKYGGARVSDVHANFIVNDGGATAKDVVSLMKLIQQEVYDKFGVKLLTEVKFVGFDQKPTLF